MHFKRILIVLVIGVAKYATTADENDHKCTKLQPFYKTVTSSTWHTVPVQKVVRCTRFYDRVRKKTCYAYAEELKEVISNEYKVEYQEVTACCSGYVEKDSVCVPTCDNCWNGNCIGPNQCECHEGYEMQGSDCRPVCNNCTNGFCAKPNVCDCHNGYDMDGDGKCVPHCTNCENGECVGVDKCECNEGYTRLGGLCQPQCKSGCKLGFCAKPDVCECYAGYEFPVNNTTECKPKCGRCVNGECIQPYRCECLPGFVNIFRSSHLAIATVCVPKCDPVCENGNCTAPNVCSCDPGYVLAAEKTNACEPTCDPPCKNAGCIAPDICLCDNGFRRTGNTTYECEPECFSACEPNGHCIAPNTCTCLPGYSKTNGSECTAVCDEPCLNGRCDRPNECKCDAGYHLEGNDKFTCKPICEGIDCTYGECIQPEECVCHVGYHWATINNTETCAPICMGNCDDHGTCIAPDNCQCDDGYSNSSRNESVCVPNCDPECSNGDCVDPNVCLCHPGFVNDHYGGCIAMCDIDCVNADCKNDKCECWEGYQRNNVFSEICDPYCEEDCSNGTCMGNNTCICDEGFHNEPTQSMACVPNVCPRGCENGICISPADNICTCYEGYVLEENSTRGTCVPYCFSTRSKSGCTNATCIAPDTCRCYEGFEFIYGSNSTCVSSTKTSDALFQSGFGYGLMGIVIIAIVASILATMFLIYRKNRVASEMSENSSSNQGLSITTEEEHHLL